MRKRKVVLAESRRKVYSNLKKKVAFACLVAEKGGLKLHVRERRDDEPAFGIFLDSFRRGFTKNRISLGDVENHACIDDPAHGSSPSRSSFIHSAVVRGLLYVAA